MKAVSIVIPVYNTELFLEECLDSVLEQETKLDIEVICINDESPDNSLKILHRYQRTFPNVLKVIDQPNTGGATAINRGILAARGDFILILDSDDYLLPDSLDSLYDRAIVTDAKIVVGKMLKLTNNVFSSVEETDWISGSAVLSTPKQRCQIFISKMYHGKLMRRDFLVSENIFMKDGQIYADGPFVAKAYTSTSSIATLNKDVVVWRKRESSNNLSITDRKKEARTLLDHMESLSMSWQNTASANESLYLEKLLEFDSRRPVWHLFPFWLERDFSFKQLSRFYEATADYYSMVRHTQVKNLPRAEGFIVRSLFRRNRYEFYLFCYLYYCRIRYRQFRARTRAGLRKYSPKKLLGKLAPIGLKRAYRKIKPNYAGHDIFRSYLSSTERDDNLVVFESFFGKSYSGNPKYIHQELARHYPEFRSVWVYNKQPLDILNCEKQVRRGSDEYFQALAKSKYWVNNIQFPVHEKADDTVYIQTWHGTPLKKLGWDIEVSGPEAGAREKAYRESRNWDYLLSQNSYSTEIFRRCFKFGGKILEQGYPINDIWSSPELDRIKQRVKDSLGIPASKRVVLYAPTWRDNNPLGNWIYKADDVFDYEAWSRNAPSDVVLLLKFHHLVLPPRLNGYEQRIMSVSDYDDTQELLAIADCLITDYSSIFFDYLNSDRPIIYYAYDLAEYQDSTRDMYVSMDQLPGPVVTSFSELLDRVDQLEEVATGFQDLRDEFAAKFCPNDDGSAANRILGEIFKASNAIEHAH
ncbi:CDP-glycerol:glycerophosphate glycerophosphotransferase [Seongchinamella unica]|uniref:CDP-glycerol:glycerophosphate glycerophosphotransferase n=1 Tax=Seongchinamella unica TaxID=2547392 RepID=A0A4R5LNB4_9GAMM|nr:bifunctional glycosyltransferase family 2 protein/CDP-glycerol:glycerophosphate glycerophosphotransferase [Seongchinamella unica]TDG11614.1 CDP-glycerol:glycerophosphate glycerophosphotransferase [Seongchinamella unica]